MCSFGVRGAGFLIALAALASPAGAQAPLGPYIGAGIGASNVSVEAYEDDDCCYYYGYEYDQGEEDLAFTVHAGWRLHPYVAIEAGYLDAGEPEWNERFVYVPDLDDVFDTDVVLDLKAGQLSILGILPFGDVWEIYVRAGAAYWWADADQLLVRDFDGAVVERAVNDEGTTFLIGLGFGVSPTPAWRLRLEFQSFSIEEDLLAANDDSTLDTILLETQFRFGRSRPRSPLPSP
jgi:opacity protein-like surface antigen